MTERHRARLRREWVLCALAALGARFVPVPVLDDVIRDRAVRTAVERTWIAHDRPRCPAAIDVLCAQTQSLGHRVAAGTAKLPLTLALYPVRKIARTVTAVRGVWSDAAEVLLLARAVDRCLQAGWFAAADPDELVRQAGMVRRAHQEAVRGSDLHLVSAGLRRGLRHTRGLREPAARFARRAFGDPAAGPRDVPHGPREPWRGSRDLSHGPLELPHGPDGARLEAGVEDVEAGLARAEATGLFDGLDRRFDAALGRLAAPATARAAARRRPRR